VTILFSLCTAYTQLYSLSVLLLAWLGGYGWSLQRVSFIQHIFTGKPVRRWRETPKRTHEGNIVVDTPVFRISSQFLP